MSLRHTIKITILMVIGCYALSDAADIRKKGSWKNVTSARAKKELLENPDKTAEIQPDRVLQLLGVKPGDVVAVVGSRSRIFTFLLADKVGKNGKVYAVNFFDDMIDYINRKMNSEGVTNITSLKSSDTDPHLPPASCDAIIMTNTYQHLGNKPPYFKKIRESLRAGGSIAVISVVRPSSDIDAKAEFEQNVISEMKRAGFALHQKHGFLNNYVFLVFK